jgi:ribulose-phosphate 3-epimerase
MPKPHIITSSILSADFARLGEQIAEAEAGGTDWIHIDVMDGHFVPNLTMGPFVVATCRRITNLQIDVHLMVREPEKMLYGFAEAGANLIYVHMETCPHLYRTLQDIRSLGCKAGVVLNPGTPAVSIETVLHLADVVLIMTVNPGYSGQTFIPQVVPKIREVRQMLDCSNPEAMIAVDGGITEETLPIVLEAGAQVFIVATAIFNHPEGIKAGIQSLKRYFPQ